MKLKTTGGVQNSVKPISVMIDGDEEFSLKILLRPTKTI